VFSDLEMKAYLPNVNNNIATPLQSTSTNGYTPTASPSRPVDFSNHGNRVNYENLIGSLTTENPRSGHEEVFEDNNYYNL